MATKKLDERFYKIIEEGLSAGVERNDIAAALIEAGYPNKLDSAKKCVYNFARNSGIDLDSDKRAAKNAEWYDLAQQIGSFKAYQQAQREGYEATYSGFQKRMRVVRKAREKQYRASSVAVTPRYDANSYELNRMLDNAMHYFDHYQKKEKSKPILDFDSTPICLVFMGDQHIGNKGTDYDRLWREAAIVAETKGMYCIQGGDLVDNYVIGRLSDMRAKSHARMTIPDEWAMMADYLGLFGDKIKAVVGGNHDKWTAKVSGIDFLRHIVQKFMTTPIYDSDDLTILVNIGDWPVRVRVRHKWRSSSKLNPTHGIEDFYRHNGGFDIGVGFHTHTGGFSRAFLGHEGSHCLAVQCGAYKRVDSFAKECGFPASNRSTAMAVIFDPENRCYFGVDNLETAARIMGMYYE